ncbi:MAG: TIGR03667 family PPOX class F420-dependent oxidoreductase [Ktedonobacterales bacterium]
MLDLSQEHDAHIDQRLRSDLIMWIGTVRPDGSPHLVPVWFVWDGKEVLIFSQPSSRKVRNIRENPHVVLALDDTKGGEDVITIEGEAELLPTGSDVMMTYPAYAEKYGEEVRGMNTTVEALAKEYSQGIRVTPRRFLG